MIKNDEKKKFKDAAKAMTFAGVEEHKGRGRFQGIFPEIDLSGFMFCSVGSAWAEAAMR